MGELNDKLKAALTLEDRVKLKSAEIKKVLKPKIYKRYA